MCITFAYESYKFKEDKGRQQQITFFKEAERDP
jgi:hypothetical protein